MKKIGKESNGSELFTVIEPGMPSNQLSEMEKDLILGGECDPVECLGDGCPVHLCYMDVCWEDGDCLQKICPILDDFFGSESDSESDSESYSDEFRYSIMA